MLLLVVWEPFWKLCAKCWNAEYVIFQATFKQGGHETILSDELQVEVYR
jgi:hypothetical protein